MGNTPMSISAFDHGLNPSVIRGLYRVTLAPPSRALPPRCSCSSVGSIRTLRLRLIQKGCLRCCCGMSSNSGFALLLAGEHGQACYVSGDRLGGVGIVFVKDCDSELASYIHAYTHACIACILPYISSRRLDHCDNHPDSTSPQMICLSICW